DYPTDTTPLKNSPRKRSWFKKDNQVKLINEKSTITVKRLYYETTVPVKINDSDFLYINTLYNQLIEDTKRNEFVLKAIIELHNKDKKLLVLTSKLDHIYYLKNEIEKSEKKVGFFTQKMSEREINEQQKETIILSTSALITDHKFKNIYFHTVIFLMPIKKLSYFSSWFDKHNPNIIEIVDDNGLSQNFALCRLKYYRKKDYDIKDVVFNSE
ncbi:MAG: hypothetical protein H0X03_07095, partial [Nitrosopumilus sp.]|nr:hypothetical protein [Nitrosopumilus sp.]